MDDLTHYQSDTEYLPPDLLLDSAHPASGEFLRNLEMIKKRIVDASCGMWPIHIEVVKLAHSGKKTAVIASKLDLHPKTVRNTLKSPDARRLSALLAYLSLANEGPRVAQQRHMLWQIAVDNRESDPRVSIAANAEITKMRHQREVLEKGLTDGNKIEIIINNETLPRTVLDQ